MPKFWAEKNTQDALASIKNCINDLGLKMNDGTYSKEDLFKVITIIQDIGSGKTHLTLHMKTIHDIVNKAIVSYVDLAQVRPREIDTIFSSIIKGFDGNYFNDVLKKLVEYVNTYVF